MLLASLCPTKQRRTKGSNVLCMNFGHLCNFYNIFYDAYYIFYHSFWGANETHPQFFPINVNKMLFYVFIPVLSSNSGLSRDKLMTSLKLVGRVDIFLWIKCGQWSAELSCSGKPASCDFLNRSLTILTSRNKRKSRWFVYLTLCLPWGPMDPKMKFDLALLKTDNKQDFHVTWLFLSFLDFQRGRVPQILDKPIWLKK